MNEISSLVSGSAGASPALPLPAKGANKRSAAAVEDLGSARITLSAAGRGLASMPELMQPNSLTVRQLATELARTAGKIFRDADIAPTPPVEFRVDGAGGIHVGGEREDRARVEALLAETPELAQAVRNLNGIASHAHAIEAQGHAAFSAEYQASSEPQAVVARYGHLFSGMLRNDTSVVLDGERVDVVANGQRWVTSA